MSSWSEASDLLKSTPNYTYGVGEKSGEEWKAHEAAQAKKLKAYKTAQASAPALTSAALHKKYNRKANPEMAAKYDDLSYKYDKKKNPKWKKTWKKFTDKYPQVGPPSAEVKKGVSSWSEASDLLKGHGCKGCAKCEGKHKGKSHHDKEHMHKGITSWFGSSDTLYKSGWEEANDLLKGGDPSKEEYKDLTGKQLFSQTKGEKLASLVKEHKTKQAKGGIGVDEEASIKLAQLKGPQALRSALKTHTKDVMRAPRSGVTRGTAKEYYNSLLNKYGLGVKPSGLVQEKQLPIKSRKE